MPPVSRIHPTAIISPDAVLDPSVEVGPFVVIEGSVTIDAGTVIRPRAHLMGPLIVGPRNHIGTGTVIGDRPQHLLYVNQPTAVRIGEANTFRENVTIHRGYVGTTVIGNGNYLMVGSHVGHDVVVGNNCLFANGAMVGGHCIIQDRVLLAGGCGVHQFGRIGRLALVTGLIAATQDIPPFLIAGERNQLSGVNVIGMRRAGIPADRIRAVRSAFTILRRPGWLLSAAVTALETELGHIDEVREMITFIRQSKRGVATASRMPRRPNEEAA